MILLVNDSVNKTIIINEEDINGLVMQVILLGGLGAAFGGVLAGTFGSMMLCVIGMKIALDRWVRGVKK